METNKNYLLVGTFVLITLFAITVFSVWLMGGYNDNKYTPFRIYFADSVNGLYVGSPVKFRGVQVGKVDAMAIAPDNINLIRVDISILKTTPIKEDTVATQKLQGIGGGVYVELSGGDPKAADLASNNSDLPPEIKSETNTIATLMDQLPVITDKITHIADQIDKLLSDKNIKTLSSTLKNLHKSSNDVNELTADIKEHPTKLLFPSKK